jgi:hypothetical protein
MHMIGCTHGHGWRDFEDLVTSAQVAVSTRRADGSAVHSSFSLKPLVSLLKRRCSFEARGCPAATYHNAEFGYQNQIGKQNAA